MALDEEDREKASFACYVGCFSSGYFLVFSISLCANTPDTRSVKEVRAKVETAEVSVSVRRNNVLEFCHR